MFGKLGSVLQQIADGLTSGTIVVAVATIAIAIVGYMWSTSRMSTGTAASVIIGIAVVGSAAEIASALVS
jgi:type IV secretory pathway VirB2 component (pilin)